jgi:hypothetical protein
MSRTTNHPILAAGNLTEGLIGIAAIAAGAISLATFGFTAPLVFSFLYTIGITALALFSAYHLYF